MASRLECISNSCCEQSPPLRIAPHHITVENTTLHTTCVRACRLALRNQRNQRNGCDNMWDLEPSTANPVLSSSVGGGALGACVILWDRLREGPDFHKGSHPLAGLHSFPPKRPILPRVPPRRTCVG